MKLLDRVLARAGARESEDELIDAADRYWNAPADAVPKSDAHWRGAGGFSDDALWLQIGRDHLDLYEAFARAIEFTRPLDRIVDWGCGGGANAVHFGPLAREYVGVDVAAATLDECRRQAEAAGTQNFRPVLIEIEQPESAIDSIGVPCDLFLCTFVFELIPSRDYGLRLLRIAKQLLSPGGMAIIQIKYDTGSWRTASHERGYVRNLSTMTTYAIDGFWSAAEACGLIPKLVTLVPQHALDPRYAYFLLVQPDRAADEPSSR